MSDLDLVALTQQGNVGAFNRLTARTETGLYRFALRFLGNREDARDVCQEALVKAYVNIDRLRDGGKFRSWLHHIALNLCRDRYRSREAQVDLRSVELEELEVGELATVRGWDHQSEGDPGRTILLREIERVFTRLPAEQRFAILLREYHGFTTEEVGEITGVPVATVRTRIFYGLRAVRRMLKQRGIE